VRSRLCQFALPDSPLESSSGLGVLVVGRGGRSECAAERGAAGCSGGPALLAQWRFALSRLFVGAFALLRSSATGVRPTLTLPRSSASASYCAAKLPGLLSTTLSASPQSGLPAIRFSVGCTPCDPHPGLDGLCSTSLPPSQSDLDADANCAALTPRPRLSSFQCSPDCLTKSHSLAVRRSLGVIISS
jgi:hypothetical protein